jgi:hypothetical protein
VTAPVGTSALDALAESRAWKRGNLGHLLSRRQRRAVAKLRASLDSGARVFLLNWSRRGGKSRTLCVYAVEECLRAPKSSGKGAFTVLYAAPTQEMARNIVLPLMREILMTAPGGTYAFSVQAMRWTFANGATIRLAGLDGLNADRLRGGGAHRAIVDEGGFVDGLTYALESVLRPQLVTTDGAMVLASTPAVSPVHPFTTMAQEMRGSADYDECTLEEAEHIGADAKASAIEDAGGRDSPTCKREYFCALDVTDTDRAIVPEFQQHREKIVVPWKRPDFMDRYVSADFGFHDLTVVLFAYLDFENAKLVIEHELVFQGKSALDVGDAVKRTEAELWQGAAPVIRVADAPLQQLADLAQGSGIHFRPAMKLDAEASLNHLRRRVSREQIVITPNCKTTIAHMHYGVWNKARTAPDKEFARQDGMGHFDAIDAMKYLARHVDWSKMPDRPLPKRGDDIFILRDRKNDLATQLRRRD